MILSEELQARILADSRDRPSWMDARVGRIGGSDAASYAKVASAPLYLKAKLNESFDGNAYTTHGNDRERAILARFGLEQNTMLFRSESNPRHVCTPDSIVVNAETGEITLVQVKTSSKPINRIVPTYQRQMWWEQYVMGSRRTLFVWEQHESFQPLNMEPESMWHERDDSQIETLITIADLVLAGMDSAAQFRKEIQS